MGEREGGRFKGDKVHGPELTYQRALFDKAKALSRDFACAHSRFKARHLAIIHARVQQNVEVVRLDLILKVLVDGACEGGGQRGGERQRLKPITTIRQIRQR
ncbi:hypothetical protein KKB55_10215 [Myxococcota bacterium]|nr:hypothetical protein [Myxococcota bacterium]